MFLKRLDIVGFKSFAERVSIDYDPGVTAVVGPNGSGKSNITDAIRWVLGEQSAKSLRGAKMEDIIFVGSDSRKALNVAEVTLTLDNEDHFLPIDYHEVSVTRRVYRSGDSEFFINKQSCRLKDIIDLFMDSGLGREAFSIISQGKIEEILSSKAEERRTIFEEAAGVLKYKSRKKKAEYKLAETQENLNRVTDILHELEEQIEPLKIQASVAKDFLDKKEELEQIEISLTVHEIEDFHQKWKNLHNQFEEHKDQELQLSSTLQKEEIEIEELGDQRDGLDHSVDELQQVLLVASEELEKVEGRKEVLKERKKNADHNKNQLQTQIVQLEEKIKEYNESNETENLLLKQYQADLRFIQGQFQEKDKLFAAFDQNIDEKLEGLKSEYIELLNRQASSRNELSYIQSQKKQQNIKSARIDESNDKYIKDRVEIQAKKLRLQTKLSEVQEEINKQIKRYRDEQAKLEKSKTDYQKKETNLYKAYQFLQQTRSRKEMLEEMQDDYAGFFQGVKEILKVRDEKLSGIEGAIAELIHVPKEYETAIEIALGGSAQHIVVDDEENARAAINYLKQHSFGRATFLPLAVIKERKIAEQQIKHMKNHPSYIGVASTLISFDEKYRSVLSNLLGTVIVTSDLKGANELARLMNFRYRLVTLDGDVVNPGGSMTGGAVKQKTNSLLGRSRELEIVTEKLIRMEDETDKLEKLVQSIKQSIHEQEKNLESLRETGETVRLKEQKIKSEIREVEIEEKNVNERLALYDYEKESTQTERANMENRLNELQEELSELSTNIQQFTKLIEQITSQKQNQQTSKEIIQTEITDLKVILAEKKQILKNQQEKVSRIDQDLENESNLLRETQKDLALLNDEMDSSSTGEEQLEAEASKKMEQKNETIQLISSKREQRLKIQVRIDDRDHELKELKRQYKQLIEVLKDEEVKISRLDVELDNRLTHLREEYMLTFEAAKEKYPLQMEVAEARKKLKLVKLTINELGTVNLGAIDEYERVFSRYNFLNEQKYDLQKAKETLYKVMDEMDEEMKKRFQTTFTNIQTHFESVFKALFGGGRAALKLTDPSDLLNTGVDIIAQPPGKKLQNLGLLSGGERALTAIALLFSILKVRPVPFCVLDEVEAALDEANVHRFARYLKKFSIETQFIVITHRKGTMEGADVLYGVTMQESGVSKLVSVRLEESKELVK